MAASLREGADLRLKVAANCGRQIVEAALLISDCLAAGGKLLLFGNGGSAADAQHLAAEFVGRFVVERPGLAAIALTTDSSILTAVANDYGFERVFARQIEALARPGDVAIGISTSGNSANVLAAMLSFRKFRAISGIPIRALRPGLAEVRDYAELVQTVAARVR